MRELKIMIKPLTIEVNKERELIYQRLKRQLEELQLVANDSETSMRLRLRAAGLIVHVCQALANVLEDMQLEAIEEKIKKLKAALEEEKRSRKVF